HLSQYKGKVTVMIFILTTCPHCQKTIGFLSKDQKEFGPRGFQVLASAIQEDAPKAVPDFVKDFKTTFPVGYNNSQQEGRAVLDFMQHPPMLIPHMPLLSFLDREGRIRAQYEGMDPFMEESVQEENIRKQILALLNEGGAAAKKAPAKKTAAKK
ncbi:MAG TPA: TlpA disulfide reductase family protein, partial [Bryobacteraceae bacterium]